MFGKDEIVILLGAGASVEAGIASSCQMIEKIESLIQNDWKQYAQLYHFIKSAIFYSSGIKGVHGGYNYNVEKLVSTIDELLKSDEHPLYPFIGSWTPKLSDVAGINFNNLIRFREEIIEKLVSEWLILEYETQASYYGCLQQFQKSLEYPLRIFSLNYDLCIEKICKDSGVERGFSNERTWDWRIFDDESLISGNIYLYKLHGSIDWTKNENGQLIFKDGQISPDKAAIIFGANYKLQSIDPFLFFVYELRKRTLTGAKLIICVGYGFADDHINGILSQSLKADKNRKILIVNPNLENKDKERIKQLLGQCPNEKIIYINCNAKEYFEKHLNIKSLECYFPVEELPFEEVSQA